MPADKEQKECQDYQGYVEKFFAMRLHRAQNMPLKVCFSFLE